MSKRISDKYLKDFFNLDDSEESKADLEELSGKLKKLTFEHGENIITAGEDADGMFFIESGSATVLNKNGEQVNLMHIGQYFGEYAVLTGEKRLTTVRAFGKTVVYKVENEDLLSFLSKHPHVYSEMMKKVYGQLSSKHSQILALSSMKKGVLSHPANDHPITLKQGLFQYGFLALVVIASFLLPRGISGPIFLLPLIFMIAYVLITKRTLESIVASCLIAGILAYKGHFLTGTMDALIETFGAADNVFTVIVMVLMGALVNLIVNSGGVTAFEKSAAKHAKSQKHVFFTSFVIMIMTSIDEGLNMLCAQYALYNPSKEKRIPRERQALFYGMLPVVLCSFVPLSLWGIFVIGTMNVTFGADSVALFCKAIPFNFFSIITVIAMILLSLGKLPRNKQLKAGDKRVEENGDLWPEGSEKYLSEHSTEVWGKISNVMLPIIVLMVASLAVRSISSGSFSVDSSIGLTVALLFTFALFCLRRIMSPSEFVEYAVQGIADSTLPVIMYLMTIFFSSMLDTLKLDTYFELAIDEFDHLLFLLPAAVFLFCMLLTTALGSSWAMYAIAFPIVYSLVKNFGIDSTTVLALFIGAIAGAGIAGEKNCAFTFEALNVGTTVGIAPDVAKKLRLFYSTIVSLIAFVLYLIAGIICFG